MINQFELRFTKLIFFFLTNLTVLYSCNFEFQGEHEKRANTFLSIKILRPWISKIEEEFCPENEMIELNKGVEKIQSKELTKRKWMHVLTNCQTVSNLLTA